MDIDKISKLIKNKRKEKGLTQVELANKLNVTEKAISRWETGRGTPDISLLVPLSKELGIEVRDLLSGKENNIKNKDIEKVINYIEVNKKSKNKYIIIIAVVLYTILLFLYLAYLRMEFNRVYNITFVGEFVINSIFGIGIIIINNYIANNYIDKNEDRKYIKKFTYLILLILYCIMFFNLTIFGRRSYGIFNTGYNLIPFKTIIGYLKHLNWYDFKINILGNIVILMPLEFFIIKLFEIKKINTNIIINVILVAIIEFLQFFTGTGVLDIDDIILNVFGMTLIFLTLNKIKFNKNMIIKSIIVIIISGILLLSLNKVLNHFKYSTYGNILDANITCVNLGNHSSYDFDKTIDIILKEFKISYRGSKLISINYDYYDVKDMEEEIINEFNSDDAMVLSMEFKSGPNTPGLNPNNRYLYRIWLIKVGSKWSIINVGQG